jgi:RNA recognition motif-containing protein
MDIRIYVGNLNKSTTQDEISTLFATAGTVSLVKVATDSVTGKSKGFAFVSMPPGEADMAISMFNDFTLADKKLRVNVAMLRIG